MCTVSSRSNIHYINKVTEYIIFLVLYCTSGCNKIPPIKKLSSKVFPDLALTLTLTTTRILTQTVAEMPSITLSLIFHIQHIMSNRVDCVHGQFHRDLRDKIRIFSALRTCSDYILSNKLWLYCPIPSIKDSLPSCKTFRRIRCSI